MGPAGRETEGCGKTRGAGRSRERSSRTCKDLASLNAILRRLNLSLTGDWVNSRRRAWAQPFPDIAVTSGGPPGVGRSVSSLQSHAGRLTLTLPASTSVSPSSCAATEPILATLWHAGKWGIPGPSRGAERRRPLHAGARSARPTPSLVDAIGPLGLSAGYRAPELRL